jgi:hypothetical protein
MRAGGKIGETFLQVEIQYILLLHDNIILLYYYLIVDTTFIGCDKQTVCLGETVTCTCTVGNSNSFAWTSDGNRVLFTSSDPLLTRRSVTGSSTFAVLTDNSDTNGIRVITSNFTFVASSVGSNVLTCQNIDRSTSESVIIPVSGM